jgi:hypothetical protein
MRDRWLILGAALGATLLLPIAGSAQTLSVPPSWAPSLAQSPTMPPPEPMAPAPTAAPANQAAAPASSATEIKPAEKLKARATAQNKAASKTAKAKTRKTMAPVAQSATPAGEGTAVAKPKATGRLRAVENATRAPRDIVATIYKVAAGKDGSYDGPSAFDDSRIRKLYFSKGLIALVAATEKKTPGGSILNFDPITNSEGPDVEDLNIAPESEKADRMSVAAHFNSQSDSSIIHYDFVKEGRFWKLDNIRGEIVGQQGQWSLREILGNDAQRS